MSDDDEAEPGKEAEERGAGLAPAARDLEGELTERRRERFGPTAADVPAEESETPEPDTEFLEPPAPDPDEVDSEITRPFWGAVLSVNISLFAIALGLLLIAFRGRTLVGGGLVAAGLFALYRAWSIYQEFTAASDADGDEADTDDAESDDQTERDSD